MYYHLSSAIHWLSEDLQVVDKESNERLNEYMTIHQ